ncbi:MAG: type II secretion system F family protein [Defluviitaleaceae bacterium]|nr:type II secretion system F family protein [Defluviitaleaceae bacterium]
MPINPGPVSGNLKRESIWHMDVADLLSFGRRPSRPLSLKDLAVFCRKAAFLLNAGLPIKAAMPILYAQMPGRALKSVVSDVHKMVMQGEKFSKAIKVAKVFPAFMCGYVDIGEKTAQLPKVCEQLADFYEQQATLKDELTAAMMYPAAVSLMMLGVIVLAVTLVIPGYSDMFAASGVPLPALTAMLIGISDFLGENWLVVLAGISGGLIIMLLFLRSSRGKAFSSRIKLRIPLLRQNINFRLVQAMSLLLSSGLSVSRAIPLCREITENSRVREDLQNLSANVDAGIAFWEALGQMKYIDPLLIGLARVGEETGSLPQTIQKCHYYFEAAYRHNIRRMNKLIEPLVTLVMGVILAAVMLAVVLPTFELATVL